MLTAIFILCLFGPAKSAQPAKCSGKTLTDANRDKLVQLHNDIRSQLAQGSAPTKAGTLPAGKDIYELNYDCGLEDEAGIAPEHACGKDSAITTQTNTQSYTSKVLLKLGLDALLEASVEEWYKPALLNGIGNADNKLADAAMQSFANIANSEIFKFGCNFKNCSTPLPQGVITCKYEKPVALQAVIYPKGASCRKDEDCPQQPNPSYCDVPKSLCMTTKPVATTTAAITTTKRTTTTAKGKCANAEMTDDVRNRIVTLHNNYRMSVAQGKVKNGRNNYNCPKAANMFEMIYDCRLETSAISYAKQCSLTASSVNSRPGQGENVFVGSQMGNKLTAAEMAIESWSSQISRSGINKKMKFMQNLRDKHNAPLAFTQMVWALSTRVGCAVIDCSGRTFTVCRYSPAGNILNQLIYQQGQPCGKCYPCLGNGLCRAP